MRLADLADAARKSGLKVVEVDGWRSRGHGSFRGLAGIVCHHTATAKTTPGDYPSLRVVRDGRTGLAGPLSQLGLGRSGTVYVIAAGVAWHAGTTHRVEQGNFWTIGIEAEHPGGNTSWPKVQYDAYVRLVAALCRHYDIPPANVQGHKEVAKPTGRKVDPTFSMPAFRDAVAEVNKPKPKPPTEVAKARASLRKARRTALAKGLTARADRILRALKALPRR